jgi:hypothetical protein
MTFLSVNKQSADKNRISDSQSAKTDPRAAILRTGFDRQLFPGKAGNKAFSNLHVQGFPQDRIRDAVLVRQIHDPGHTKSRIAADRLSQTVRDMLE